MDISFYIFLLSTAVVILLSAIMVFLFKKNEKKEFGDAFVSPAGNCEMNTDRYSGKYSVYKKSEVIDDEF